VRRIFAILLLAVLPFQFSWAAVASYCGHETQIDAGHFGHHEHQHDADASDAAGLDANVDVSLDADDGKAPGAMDLDCGQCHGSSSMMLNLPSTLLGALSTAHPSITLDEAGGAHAPTRPERPQWLPLA
jgi:hypothetical protein